jgi:hypothetical protein
MEMKLLKDLLFASGIVGTHLCGSVANVSPKLYNWFKNGDESLENEEHCTRPAVSKNDENVAKVHIILISDWWVVIQHIGNMPHILKEDQLLAKNQIPAVSQPMYSPHLTPCDLWLLMRFEIGLKGHCLVSVEEIQQNTRGQLEHVCFWRRALRRGWLG